MSAEKARHVEGELRASREQELSKENARLRAQVSGLEERLTQAEKKLEKENALEGESERKRRRIALDSEQQRVSQDEDDAMTGVDRAPEQDKQEKCETEIENITEVPSALLGHEGNEPTVEYIKELPSALLGHALGYLTFLETRGFFGCGNRVLWEEKRVDYDSQMMHHLVLPTRPPYAFLHSNLTNVCSLDLGPWCSDIILAYIRDERVLPNLKHLGMARSINVTDEGLALLPQNPVRRRKLKSLDVHFCRRVSFERTLDTRELFDALELIRRLPPCLDGIHIRRDGGIYKSWADGTYVQLNKDGTMAECGHVCDLYESGSEDCVVSKTQMAWEDYDWQSLPEWQFHANRYGNRYLRAPGGLVLQARLERGLYPPNNFPLAEHANSVPIGHKQYFDEEGNQCNEDDPNKYVKVYCFQLQSLGVFMPPPEIVALCRTQLSNMRRVMAERDQEQAERQNHSLEGGNETDEPPPEWFQYST